MEEKMIDINNAQKNFLKYVQNYDLNNENIKRKEQHSLRVMAISKKIAEELKLSEEEIKLATLIGLIHDIGRFEQYTKWKTFSDRISTNHGVLGAKILEENNFIRTFITENKYDEIIKKAIINHNKYQIDENLNETELLYSKIIRDADKIDILYEVADGILMKDVDLRDLCISENYFRQFHSKKAIKIADEQNDLDKLILKIAFIFDLNFECSKKIIKEEKYIERILNRFEFKNEKTDKLRLNYVELTKASIACVLQKDHPLARQPSVTPADLKDLSIVLCQPPVPVFSDISAFQQKEASNFSPANSYFSENIDEACTLVKAGLGFSLLPDLLPSRDPELAYIPYDPSNEVSYGVYYKGKKKDPLLKLFIELTKNTFLQ